MNAIKVKKIVFTSLLAASCLFSIVVMMPRAAKASQNSQKQLDLLIDGEEVKGVKRFSYKVDKSRWNAARPGFGEWTHVKGGDNVFIRGKIMITLESDTLKRFMDKEELFDIELPLNNRSQISKGIIGRLSLDNCRIISREIQIKSHGYNIVVYTFIAERIDEE